MAGSTSIKDKEKRYYAENKRTFLHRVYTTNSLTRYHIYSRYMLYENDPIMQRILLLCKETSI